MHDVSDGVRWRCTTCKTSTSIRDGSFFAKSKLPLQKWLILILWWAQEYPVTDAKAAAEVDVGTAVDVYRSPLEVLEWLFKSTSLYFVTNPRYEQAT